jgi:hypothetical protein
LNIFILPLAPAVRVPEFLQGLCPPLETTKPLSVQALAVDADEAEIPSEKILAVELTLNELVAKFKQGFLGGRSGVVQVNCPEGSVSGVRRVHFVP